jgi:hypothetical protein
MLPLNVALRPAAGERDNLKRTRSWDAEAKPGAVPVGEGGSPTLGDVQFVHNFDTEDRSLQRLGYVLELRERAGSLRVVIARSGDDDDRGAETAKWAQARIDSCWAIEILAGAMSPLAALERRLGTPRSDLVEKVMAIVDGRKLRRIGSRAAGQGTESHERSSANRATGMPFATLPTKLAATADAAIAQIR